MGRLRPSRDFYYLDIAKSVSERSTCINKHYGAVIVKNDEIISTGYNGAPRCRKNCIELGECYRLKNNIPRGTRYELCRSVHAEQNAIISASRNEMLGSTLYLYGWDVVEKRIVRAGNVCTICRRMIINAGIETIVIADADLGVPSSHRDYRAKIIKVADWISNDESLEQPGITGY